MGLEALFGRLSCHQTLALKGALAIYRPVSPRNRVNNDMREEGPDR